MQNIQVHRGFAFVWYIKPDDADKAMAALNGKRIYAGVAKDRIEESANHKLSSVVRKEQKGRIVGVRGRVMAVDKALSKEVYDKLEAEGSLAAAVNAEQVRQTSDIDEECIDPLSGSLPSTRMTKKQKITRVPSQTLVISMGTKTRMMRTTTCRPLKSTI